MSCTKADVHRLMPKVGDGRASPGPLSAGQARVCADEAESGWCVSLSPLWAVGLVPCTLPAVFWMLLPPGLAVSPGYPGMGAGEAWDLALLPPWPELLPGVLGKGLCPV